MIEKRVHHAASKIKTGVTVGTSRKSATVAPSKGNVKSLKSGVTYKASYKNTENKDAEADEKLRNESREDNNASTQANAPSEPQHDIRPDMSFGASKSLSNAAYTVKRTRLSRKRLSIRRGAFRKARQKLQSGLRSADDTGSENISISIDAAVTGAKIYKGARVTTGLTIKTGVAVAKNAPKVSRFISNMGRAKVVRYKYSISGKTAVRTKTGVAGARSSIKGASPARPSERKPAKKSHTLSVGELNTKTAKKFARMRFAYKKGEASAFISEAAAKADRIAALKKTGKASLKVGGKALKTGSKAIKTGVLYSADYTLETLEHSADLGTQAFAVGVKGTKYAVKGIANTPKTIKTGYKAVKTVVLFPIKTGVAVHIFGKKTAQATRTLKSMGAKNAAKHLQQKLYSASGRAAKATIKLTGRILLSLTSKVALPLLLIIAVSSAVSSVASSGVTLIATVFGETFSIKGQNADLDVREYLREVVEQKKTEFVSEVMRIERDNLVSIGDYHYVRLFANNDIGQVDFSESGILKTISSTEGFITAMSPTFKTILFAAYGLEPTHDELDALIGDMWRVLIKIHEEALPVEYCSTDVDEEGVKYHVAYEDCPNRNRDKPFQCDGHKILVVTVIQGGYFELANSFFMNEITALKGLLFRNEHQEERLAELTDMHELYLVYMQEEVASHGGLPDFSGIPPEALEDEAFARLMEEATKYLGYPYLLGGFTPATSFDCSGFVYWAYTISGVYPHGRNTAYGLCKMSAPVAPSDAKPGDLVFFGGSSDHTDKPIKHVGIYIGDGKMIHSGFTQGVSYADITTPYWQSIFYSFGRLDIE